MSTKTRKQDVAILVVLAIAVGGAFLALVGWGWLRQEEADYGWNRTTHSANRDGMLVCYTLYKRLGYDVRRMQSPLMPDSLESCDVLMLIDPAAPVTEAERQSLAQWIRRGGVVVASGVGAALPWDVGGRMGAPPANYRTPHETPVPVQAQDRPLARDVSSVAFVTNEVVLDRGTVNDDDALGPVEPLFRDERGERVVSRIFGEGRIVWLADSSFLANGWIDKNDNPVLAVNLLTFAQSEARGQRVVFDEYHYGFGVGETGWGVMASALVRTPPGWATLILTAAGLLLLVRKGRRFGTRRGPGLPRRRSKVEFVRSVGATYRAVGANRLTFELLFRGFRRWAASVAGLPVSTPPEEMGRALARRAGESPERYANALHVCDAAVGAPKLSSRRLTQLVDRLAHIQSEVLDGRSRSQ